jgi:hypothetical protein
MEVKGQLHPFPPLYPRGDSPRQPLRRRLSGPHRQSGHFGEKRNFFPLPGIQRRFLGHSGRSLIFIPTGLNKLMKYFPCDCLWIIIYSKIWTRSVLYGPIYVGHLLKHIYKQLRQEKLTLFNPALDQQTELRSSLWETARSLALLGECFTKLQLNGAGNISAKRENFSFTFHPHQTYSSIWQTIQAGQLKNRSKKLSRVWNQIRT